MSGGIGRATSRADLAAPAALVLLVSAGPLKATPVFDWLPIDLTLLAGLLVALLTVGQILGPRQPHHPPVGWAALLTGVLLLGCFMVVSNDYAGSKLVYLLTLTIGCTVWGATLLLGPERLTQLVVVWLGLGIVVAVMYRLAPTTGADADLVALEGSNSISLARFAGAAVLSLAALYMAGRLRLLWTVPLGAVLLYLLLGSGSRGPLLAVGLGLLAMLAAHRHVSGRVVLTVVGVTLGGFYAYQAASPAARERFALLFEHDHGRSITTRQWLYSQAAHVIGTHPFGVGWGGLEHPLSPAARYPHDLLLEVTAEAGWLAGFVLVVMTVVAVLRCLRSAHPMAPAVLALLVFWAANAAVSGDINDNRAFFLMLFAALWLRPVQRPRPDVVRGRAYGRVYQK